MADTTVPSFDIYPLTIRGPLSDNASGVVTFARAFTAHGRLYIAQSGDKGRTIRSVTSYEIPEGTEFVRRGSKAAKFGAFSWSGCGCASSWSKWTIAQLAEMDSTPADPVDSGV